MQANLDPVGGDDGGGAFQNFLSSGVDLHDATLAAAPALALAALDGGAEGSSQEVFARRAADPPVEPVGRETSLAHGHANPELRGAGERVALHVIHIQRVPRKFEGALDLVIGLVAPTINPAEDALQIVSAGHGVGSCRGVGSHVENWARIPWNRLSMMSRNSGWVKM